MKPVNFARFKNGQWVVASNNKAVDLVNEFYQKQPRPRTYSLEWCLKASFNQLNPTGVRRVANPTHPTDPDEYQEVYLNGFLIDGERTEAIWHVRERPLTDGADKVAKKIRRKLVRVSAQGVEQAVSSRSGNVFRFMTERDDREDYTIAQTLLNAGQPWDADYSWPAYRNDKLRLVKLTEAEFRAMYVSMGDLLKAANKRAERLNRDLEQVTTLAELRAVEAAIENGWP